MRQPILWVYRRRHEWVAMTVAIRVQGLSKRFGDFEVLAPLDLVVDEGEVLGYLGPNGAGKTTTIRLLDLSVLHHVARAPASDPRWGMAAILVASGSPPPPPSERWRWAAATSWVPEPVGRTDTTAASPSRRLSRRLPWMRMLLSGST